MNTINGAVRRRLLTTLACGVITQPPAAGAASAGTAAAYPSRPVRIIVPISPGSATDVVVRFVAEKLSVALKQPVVVENRPGGGTTIAAAAVAREPADGHSLLANSTAHTVVPWIYPKLPYDAQRDFAPVAALASLPNVLVVPAARGYRTVSEVVQAARARPNALNYASAGTGTSTHLAAEKFRLATGIVAAHVPYKGTPEALAATVAGDVDFFFAPASSVLPHVKSGALLALAVSGSSQAPGLPNVRRLADAGVPGADAEFWIGLFAPKGTPGPVIERLNRELHAILAMPDVVERLTALGATPRPMSISSFDALVRSDLRAHRELVRATGLKAD